MYKHAIGQLDSCALLFVAKVDIGLKVNHRLHHHYSIQKFEEFYVENLDCCSSSFPTCFL